MSVRNRTSSNQTTSDPAAARESAASAMGGFLHRWSRLFMPLALIAVWAVVLVGLPAGLPDQVASWLTFLALLVTPGYLLAEIIVWRTDLDWIERLALAFPTSLVVLSVPGMMALLQHKTVTDLATGWMMASGIVVGVWVIHLLWRHRQIGTPPRWQWDETLLALIIGAAFLAIVPILNLYKIDGDAYAVSSFAADALAGLPLNAAEPVFGTDLGPGVRMAFNQSLPMFYLWSWFSGIDVISLTAVGSRSMLALWSLFASYTLGRAAGQYLPAGVNPGSGRRFGLFVVAVQLLIYLAAPFFRGDNVSIFFFERTTADKFMVPVTMLPVVFGLTIRYLGSGRGSYWLAAAVASFAVSTIHPLIAAMMAMALGAFGAFHWLLNLRDRQVFLRVLAMGALVTIVMALPMVQLVMARGEDPLAPSYPTSVDGWPVGHRLVPALPFLYLPSMDVYGPLPDLARVEATDAELNTNPFLVWRFAVNLERRRLIHFDLEHYISDPNIVLEPPYLLALLLLPGLLWKLRRNLGAQFAISTSLAILFAMFNPFVTPVIGSLVMPWILWRFVWMLPYALILAMVIYRLIFALIGAPRASAGGRRMLAPLVATVMLAAVLSPAIVHNLENMRLRASFPYFYPTPQTLFNRLEALTRDGEPANVLAEQDLSVTIPAFVAKANVVAHRVPTTSEIFPADQQVDALQRLIDQESFYRSRYLTAESVEILQRYDVDYVVTSAGSSLDTQLRAAPQWFAWLEEDQGYSLYAVTQAPMLTNAVEGNTAMVARVWPVAERFYRAALAENPSDLTAILGLADIAHAQGEFADAINWLTAGLIHSDEPAIYYRLGQIHTELGNMDKALSTFRAAHSGAPKTMRYSLALGDACLAVGNLDCATEQFQLAAAGGAQQDPAGLLIAQADLWRQRNRPAQALPLYEEAVTHHPSMDNKLMLASAYQEARRYSQAHALVDALQADHPLAVEPVLLKADIFTEQERFDEAVALYRRGILMQDVMGMLTADARVSLVRALVRAGDLDTAEEELATLLQLDPYNAIAYGLQGELAIRRRNPTEAIEAYQYAFRLDPTQVGIYVSLTSQMRQQGGRQGDILELLETAINANPDAAMLALAFGDQAERRGEVDAAVDAYQSALDMFEISTLPSGQNPRSNNISRAYAYTRLAGVSEDKGELEPAMNYYNAAAAAVPDLPWPRVILGDALRRRGEIDAAIAAYETAIASDDRQADAYLRLADLYTAVGDQPTADLYRREAMRIAVSEPDDTLSSGRAGLSAPAPDQTILDPTFQSDELTAATADRQTAGSTETQQLINNILQPTNQNAPAVQEGNLRLLARIYRSGSDPQQATDFYQSLIARGEQEDWYATLLSEYHKGLGDLYLAQNLPSDAALEYSQALTLDDWWPQPRVGLARALADQGLLEEAIAELREAVEIAPGYVEAQVALAGALESYGLAGEALDILQETAARHSGNANATLAYARALQNRGLWEEAEAVYRQTIDLNGGVADAYVSLATLLLEQARYDEVRILLDQAVALDQQNVNALIQYGVLEQQLGNGDAALARFNQALELRVESPTVSITLIDQLQRSAHYETAMAYIAERLQQQPDNVELLLRLAAIQRVLGNYTDALVTLLQAEEQGLSDPGLAAELGELHFSQGRPRQALAAYQQATALQPDERSYYLRIAELWRLLGNTDRAISVLKAGTQRAIDPVSLYIALSELQVEQGKTEAALETIEQALATLGEETELLIAKGAYLQALKAPEAEDWFSTLALERPDEAALHVVLGARLLEEQQWDAALAELELASRLNPQESGHFSLLGYAYQAAGRYDEAVAAYRHAIDLEPTQIDSYTELAALYTSLDNVQAARELYAKGMQVAPTNGAFYIAYVQFLLDQGEEEDALAMLDRADRIAPTTEMLTARAELYRSLGRNQDAEADLRAAIEKAPGAGEAYIVLSALYQSGGDLRRAQQVMLDASEYIPDIRMQSNR